MTPPLQVALLRKQFPALDQEQIYFDNAGGSQVLHSVSEAVSTYLSTTNVQLGASYPIGQQSTSIYETSYRTAAAYINASREDIVLGSSTTQLFRNLAFSLFEHITPGSEIIISALDHEANIASWVHLARLRDAKVIWWTPSTSSTNPHLTPSDLRALLTPKTRLVTCTHTSNILGSITPIRALADTVHSFPDALLVVDAVAYAPHREIDVLALGADVYAFSWYKVYGPHMSMLYASPRARARMTSLGHFFKPASSAEDMLGLAGASYELLAGVPAVVRYLQGLADDSALKVTVGDVVSGLSKVVIGGADEGGSASVDRERLRVAFKRIAEHEEHLQARLLDFLTSKPKGKEVTILGEPVADLSKRVPVVSFTVEGWKSKDLVLAVQEASGGKLGFRWGTFYSVRLSSEVLKLKDMDDGVVRVSLVHYNTMEELESFIKTLNGVI